MVDVLGYLVSGACVWVAAYGHALVALACWSTPTGERTAA